MGPIHEMDTFQVPFRLNEQYYKLKPLYSFQSDLFIWEVLLRERKYFLDKNQYNYGHVCCQGYHAQTGR